MDRARINVPTVKLSTKYKTTKLPFIHFSEMENC